MVVTRWGTRGGDCAIMGADRRSACAVTYKEGGLMARKWYTMDLEQLSDTPPWEWPEDADVFLLEALRDQGLDASDRLVAAELAGDYTVVNDEIFDVLLSIVSDSDETDEIRGKAAIAMGPALEHAYIDGFDDPDDCPISETTFLKTQASLHALFEDESIPKEVRRRILEASVRGVQDWHQDAVRAAYSSGDQDWMLTAVFSMEWVQGFDDQILEALESNNEDIRYQAVCAAGGREVDAAWPYVAGIITMGTNDKPLLLAAIEAVACIRPKEAGMILMELLDDDDEDIAFAAHEAIALASGPLDEFDEFDDFDDLDDFDDDLEEDDDEITH